MIYLDNAATTPLDPQVLETMLPYLQDKYFNPSANFYAGARSVRDDLEKARESICQLIGAKDEEIIFTSSGTESCNLAILGYCRKNRTDKKNHVITTKIEHHAVLRAFEKLEKEGFEVTYLDCDEFGNIDPNTLHKAIKPESFFCSIIYANNEIGTIQNIPELAKICHRNDIVFHTDACQAGSLDLNVKDIKVNMLSLNGSKIYGPKGSAILYKHREIELEPLMYGGSQEYGLRPGTENIANIIGFAKALELIQKDRDISNSNISKLRDYTISKLLEKIPNSKLNGHPTQRLPGNINLLIEGVQTESLLLKLDELGICCASGSACTASKSGLSHVIMAIGIEDKPSTGILRISIGKQNTKTELDLLIENLPQIVEEIRSLNF